MSTRSGSKEGVSDAFRSDAVGVLKTGVSSHPATTPTTTPSDREPELLDDEHPRNLAGRQAGRLQRPDLARLRDDASADERREHGAGREQEERAEDRDDHRDEARRGRCLAAVVQPGAVRAHEPGAARALAGKDVVHTCGERAGLLGLRDAHPDNVCPVVAIGHDRLERLSRCEAESRLGLGVGVAESDDDDARHAERTAGRVERRSGLQVVKLGEASLERDLAGPCQLAVDEERRGDLRRLVAEPDEAQAVALAVAIEGSPGHGQDAGRLDDAGQLLDLLERRFAASGLCRHVGAVDRGEGALEGSVGDRVNREPDRERARRRGDDEHAERALPRVAIAVRRRPA